MAYVKNKKVMTTKLNSGKEAETVKHTVLSFPPYINTIDLLDHSNHTFLLRPSPIIELFGNIYSYI
jgi:hypothetical protein